MWCPLCRTFQNCTINGNDYIEQFIQSGKKVQAINDGGEKSNWPFFTTERETQKMVYCVPKQISMSVWVKDKHHEFCHQLNVPHNLIADNF